MGRKLYVVLMGLPAMGKSTIAFKLCRNLEQEGLDSRIFNNGDLRRRMTSLDTSSPEFYDPGNRQGVEIREKIALKNLQAAKAFLRRGGHVAIIDATNASSARRRMIEATLNDHPILFIECLNDDRDLIATSIEQKATQNEFAGMPKADAVASFRKRIEYYRSIYVPLGEEANHVVIDSLHHRIIRERLTAEPPHYWLIRDLLITDWIRNLFLVRHGETYFNREDRIGGDSHLTRRGMEQSRVLADHLADHRIPFIFTSTKQRSRRMGEIVAERQQGARLFALPEFDEIDSGVCEGLSYEEIRVKYPAVYLARQQDKYHYVYPGGESYAMLHTRVGKGLKKALYISGNAEKLMIVGHRAVNRTILSHFLYRPIQDVPYIYLPQDRYFHIISTQNLKYFELKRYD